jgi:hypothetical protein
MKACHELTGGEAVKVTRKAKAEGADRRLVSHLVGANAKTIQQLIQGLTANLGEVDGIG